MQDWMTTGDKWLPLSDSIRDKMREYTRQVGDTPVFDVWSDQGGGFRVPAVHMSPSGHLLDRDIYWVGTGGSWKAAFC